MLRLLTCICALAVGLAGVACAGESYHSLSLEQWARPRQGDLVVRFPAVGDAVREYMRTPGARIQIRYPGGEEGGLWADELCDWLVALGVPSTSMEIVPGSLNSESLDLVVMTP